MINSRSAIISRLLALSFLLSLSACSTLPAFGPSSESILEAATGDELNESETVKYRLIDISQSTIPSDFDRRPQLFSKDLIAQDLLTQNQSIKPGDIIDIRVWEAADDGLFATRGQRETKFTLTVSNSGDIDVPYAGSITVAGKTEQQVRQSLLARYKGKAIDPEINVQIADTVSRSVSVLGAVVSPGLIPISTQGTRLLDLLAMAGGVEQSIWEYMVIVTRNGRKERLALDRVLLNTQNNVVLLPGDALQIEYLPRRFPVYGAISNPGNISLTTPNPKLSDLLAESGGLNDFQAEASSVFVFRTDAEPELYPAGEPTVYRLNFAKPDAFILSSQFDLKPSDIIYVASAGASEFRKFVITLISPLLGSANGAQSLGN